MATMILPSPPLGRLKNIITRVITATALYVPTDGMIICDVDLLGAGAGGGGSAYGYSLGAGGGAGGRCKKRYTKAQIGASKNVTIGIKGIGGTSSGTDGTDGGNSTFDTMTAYGGKGGKGSTINSSNTATAGLGGDAVGGDINIKGNNGGSAQCSYSNANYNLSGFGGSSEYGRGGLEASTMSASENGANGEGNCSGGSGSKGIATAGNGTDGICIITEYIA